MFNHIRQNNPFTVVTLTDMIGFFLLVLVLNVFSATTQTQSASKFTEFS